MKAGDTLTAFLDDDGGDTSSRSEVRLECISTDEAECRHRLGGDLYFVNHVTGVARRALRTITPRLYVHEWYIKIESPTK
jgi:hypothetical protein